MTAVFALSLSSEIEKYGAYAGIAAVVGLGVLSLLYFAQAREVKRLREWAGRAPERDSDLQQRVVADAQRRTTPPPAQPARPAGPATPAGVAAAAAPAPGAAPVLAAHPGTPTGPKPPVPATAAATATAAAAGATAVTGAGTPAAAPKPAVPAAAAAATAPPTAKVATPAGADGAPSTTPVPAQAKPAEGAPGASAPPSPTPSTTPPADKPGPSAPATPTPATPAAATAAAAAATPPIATPPAAPPAAATPPSSPPRPRPRPPAAPVRASRPDTGSLPPRAGGEPPQEGSRRGLIGVILGGIAIAVIAVLLITQVVSGGDEESPTTKPNSVGTPTTATSQGSSSKPQPNRSGTRVAVLNGTPVSGLARAAADRLTAVGYSNVSPVATDTTNQARATTVVYWQSGTRREGLDVAKTIGLGRDALQVMDQNTRVLGGGAPVVVIVGADQAK